MHEHLINITLEQENQVVNQDKLVDGLIKKKREDKKEEEKKKKDKI